jgi:putative oxidoreductase
MSERTVRGILLGIRILLALAFLATGIPKVLSVQETVDNFHRWGYPDGFRIFIGVAETAGAIGLLLRPVAHLAAAGLILVMLGAAFTHVTHAEWKFLIGPVVLVFLLVVTLMNLLRQRRAPLGG